MPGSEPSIHIAPASSGSYIEAALEFAEEHDMLFDDWQRGVLEDWLSYDENGKYAASTAGLSVPRQNGKTWVLKDRVEFGACVLGETILYTAHEVKTANKTFREISADFDEDNGYPDLRDQVEYIRRANGQEEIRLKDWQDDAGDWHAGGRIIFSARSRGAARGFTCDCVFFDEAQELTSEQLAALLPIISAGPLGNPQSIFIGTVPDPRSAGDVFANVRSKAMKGSGSVAWSEWSAVPSDWDDEASVWEAIAASNPGYPKRLIESAIQGELDSMARDYFMRERLGVWPPEEEETDADTVIGVNAWNACFNEAPPDGLRAYCIKCTPDGRAASVCVAVKPLIGIPHVEFVERFDLTHGSARLIKWAAERAEKAAQIVIDGASNAGSIEQKLMDRGVSPYVIQRPNTQEAITAYSAFVDAVNGCEVTHYNQVELNTSATKTTRRLIGKAGGFGFESTEEADASIVESAALALRSVLTTKRNPDRKAFII